MTSVGKRLQQLFYIGVFSAIVIFIWSQGQAPWRLFVSSPFAVLGVAAVSIFALWVQATTFILCLPDKTEPPEFTRLLTIWAFGGITSLVVPMLAGVAVRATMLKQAGMSLASVMAASMRQMILGVEYTALVVGVWFLFEDLAGYSNIGVWLIAVWLLIVAARILAARLLVDTRWLWVKGIFAQHGLRIWIYFCIQPLLFALNYWIAYYGVGYPISLSEALALAAVTALASLAVIFPNGLGVLDTIWVWVATRHGMGLAEGAGLILILRFGYLIGAGFTWFILTQVWWRRERERNA